MGIETFLPQGYTSGMPLLLGGDVYGGEDEDGFMQVRPRRHIGRDRLWQLWLQGVPMMDSRVQAWLQPHHDPAVWAMAPVDRLRMAVRCGVISVTLYTWFCLLSAQSCTR